jgi:LDH2 family malate/lactate/ureidoglycolate dehydrogenase
MKFDNLHTPEVELTDSDLRSIYGGSGGNNGSGNSGVVDALNGILNGNDIGVAVNALGLQTNTQDVRSLKQRSECDDAD